MYGFIIVSHSKDVSKGTKDIIEQMVGDTDELKVLACGGTEDGDIGTSATMVQEAIETLSDTNHILIFTDIGSSIMSSEMAIDLLEDGELKDKITLMEKPIVEGAFEAAVGVSTGKSIEELVE